MVDPCRNLSKEQLAFLKECEEEFKNRFTEADPEYRSALTREAANPPLVHPWKENQNQNRGYNNNRFQRGGGGGHRRRY